MCEPTVADVTIQEPSSRSDSAVREAGSAAQVVSVSPGWEIIMSTLWGAFVRHDAGLGGGRTAMDQGRVGRPAQLLVLHRPPPPGHGRMGVTLMSTAFAFPPTA